MTGVSEQEVEQFYRNMNGIASKAGGGLFGLLANVALPGSGVIVAPFVAYQLEKAGKYLIESRIAPRQQMRVATAYVLAYDRIAERIQSGEKPRADGFFDDDKSGRSAAEEISESAFAAARDAAEERKVPFMANLLSDIVFNAEIDSGSGHFFIAMADRLSFRSFAILAVIGAGFKSADDDQPPVTGDGAGIGKDTTLSETMALLAAGFIASRQTPETVGLEVVFGPGDIEPRKLFLTALGASLHNALGLSELHAADGTHVEVSRVFRSIVPDETQSTQLAIDGGVM